MTRLLLLIFASLLGLTNSFGQVQPPDSIYNGWLANRARSIFQQVDHGQFFGTTTGYLQVVKGKDTIVLDFQASRTMLNIIKDSDQIYDNSTKKYSTQTTSGKTALTYEAYSLANGITLILNGENYSISNIDGACDMPIAGLTFNYCHEGNTEYLTLFAVEPLKLTTVKFLMRTKKLEYMEALKGAKTITVLSGSTVILTIRK
jgi:hypothetical protein